VSAVSTTTKLDILMTSEISESSNGDTTEISNISTAEGDFGFLIKNHVGTFGEK